MKEPHVTTTDDRWARRLRREASRFARRRLADPAEAADLSQEIVLRHLRRRQTIPNQALMRSAARDVARDLRRQTQLTARDAWVDSQGRVQREPAGPRPNHGPRLANAIAKHARAGRESLTECRAAHVADGWRVESWDKFKEWRNGR